MLGTSVSHRPPGTSDFHPQRVWNGQPDGGFIADGMSPSSTRDQLGLEGSTIPGGYRAGNWPQIREVIYENVEPMLNGDISVEKALGNMDKGSAKLLKQFAKTL